MPEPPSSLAGEGRNGGPRVTARLSHGQGHRCDNRCEFRRVREVRGADGATLNPQGSLSHSYSQRRERHDAHQHHAARARAIRSGGRLGPSSAPHTSPCREPTTVPFPAVRTAPERSWGTEASRGMVLDPGCVLGYERRRGGAHRASRPSRALFRLWQTRQSDVRLLGSSVPPLCFGTMWSTC